MLFRSRIRMNMEFENDVAKVSGIVMSYENNSIDDEFFDLISWLQSPSAVLLEPKIKSATVSTVSPSICREVMGLDALMLDFLNVEF